MRTLICAISVLFFLPAIYAQTIPGREADSIRGRFDLTESERFRTHGNRDTGRQYADDAARIFSRLGNKALLGKAYVELANYYDYDLLNKTLLVRIQFLEKAIAALKESSDLPLLAWCYKTLANLHQHTNEYAAAYQEIKLSIKYYEQIHYPEVEGAYSLMSRLYYAQGDYREAVDYGFMALKAANENKDTSALCEIFNNLGYAYYKLEDYATALDYFTKALVIAEQQQDNRTVYLLASNVVESWLKLGLPEKGRDFLNAIDRTWSKPKSRILEAGDFAINKARLKLYLALKKYDKASYYCDQLIRETKNPNINVFILSSYYENIATYLIATAQYQKATGYLRLNEALLKKINDRVGVSRSYNLWYSMDTARGDYRAANGWLLKYNRIKDSLFNATKARQIEQLQVQYETDQKTSELKIKDQQINLLHKDNTLQAAGLQRANLIKNVTMAGVGILIIAGTLFYRQYRQKQATNRIISEKNKLLEQLVVEKEWLLMEVHHRVKNNLHTIFCLLESQATYLRNDALAAIKNSQQRIYAMSLIHQMSYHGEAIGAIDLGNYITDFVNYLRTGSNTEEKIAFHLDIDPILLDVTYAIPLALVINEAVTNSIKYAFPDGREGNILIRLAQDGQQVTLMVIDDGIGIPADWNSRHVTTLGLRLMKGLSEEINATIAIENVKGTQIAIRFDLDKLPKKKSLLPDTTKKRQTAGEG